MRFLAALCLLSLYSHAAPAADEHDPELRQAEAHWNLAAPKNYSLTVRYSAFVLEYGCEVQTFNVSGRRSMPRQSDSNRCEFRPDKLGSIPALFRLARQLSVRRPGEVSAEYDPTFGYPTKFYAGSKDVEDDYFLFEVVSFKVADAKSAPN